MAPEYEKAAEQLKDYSPKVVLGKVDATVEEAIAKEHGIQGFPSLKWFVNGKATEYTGGRTADTIVSWIKKKTGPATTKLDAVADIEKFSTGSEVAVVLAAAAESPVYEAAAQAMEVPFGKVIAPTAEQRAALGLKEAGDVVVVFKKFDEGRAEKPLKADTTAEEISAFVEAHSLPLIVPFSQTTANKIFGGGVKQHVLIFVDASKKDELEKAKSEAQAVAESERGNYLFVTIDKSDTRITEYFGVSENEMPTARIVVMSDAGIKKYKLTAPGVTAAALKESIAKHAADSLELDLKSEEIPEKNDGDVFVLVGKNFDQATKQPGKDVLVSFVAPWCGHCKTLHAKWDELGAKYKDNENIVIARMDATANEVASVNVQGFPTIKLFKADSDEVVDYDGAREIPDLVAFLEKQAKSCAAPA